MQNFSLKNPLDMHLHLREGDMLASVLPYTSKSFAAGVIMPNLKTPVCTTKDAKNYESQIRALAPDFQPLMTLYITQGLHAKELEVARASSYKILKLYPKGATTNSSDGIQNILDAQVLEVLEIAQELGFILSIHGESNGFSMDREYEFASVFTTLAKCYPKLKIIIEHMSDHRSIRLLEDFENIFATLTLHHITMDLDDLLGKNLSPHHFCKPVLKTKKDKEKLLELALSAHPKVCFGSDSAPHLLQSKLQNGAAGIFSAPCLLESLITLFEEHGALENLQAFVSDNAIKNYQITLEKERIFDFQKTPCTIPKAVKTKDGEIIPLHAEKSLPWSRV
ncbi:dihydroorotase [Helicobacter mustelae]|uniref:dihydroorotase n=1 Tax=Helicobacter mustelae TaxID=217 RepID=UPI000DFFA1F2|nr:dihydroorotase [Helicobacter mustelae]STP12540.1 dihydroorotase [Helicobacter mustelae]